MDGWKLGRDSLPGTWCGCDEQVQTVPTQSMDQKEGTLVQKTLLPSSCPGTQSCLPGPPVVHLWGGCTGPIASCGHGALETCSQTRKWYPRGCTAAWPTFSPASDGFSGRDRLCAERQGSPQESRGARPPAQRAGSANTSHVPQSRQGRSQPPLPASPTHRCPLPSILGNQQGPRKTWVRPCHSPSQRGTSEFFP